MSHEDNEIGKELREAFLELLEVGGTNCHAAGETRRALIREDKLRGTTVFQFADEFFLKPGDPLKNWVTETTFSAIKSRPVSNAGAFNHFEVTASENNYVKTSR